MGVYIPNMEMPTNCDDCDFAYQDQDSEYNVYWTCAAVHKSACVHGRRDDCPLVLVPPHGRLIDADALICDIKKQTAFLRSIGGEFAEIAETLEKGFLQEIDNAPTIIPAEEEET